MMKPLEQGLELTGIFSSVGEHVLLLDTFRSLGSIVRDGTMLGLYHQQQRPNMV